MVFSIWLKRYHGDIGRVYSLGESRRAISNDLLPLEHKIQMSNSLGHLMYHTRPIVLMFYSSKLIISFSIPFRNAILLSEIIDMQLLLLIIYIFIQIWVTNSMKNEFKKKVSTHNLYPSALAKAQCAAVRIWRDNKSELK